MSLNSYLKTKDNGTLCLSPIDYLSHSFHTNIQNYQLSTDIKQTNIQGPLDLLDPGAIELKSVMAIAATFSTFD